MDNNELFLVRVISLAALLMVSPSDANRAQRDKTVSKLRRCGEIVNNIQHPGTTVNIPPDVTGRWVSSRCEVRPGPEFLVRDYLFFANMSFAATQYYYKDSSCSQPSYVIISYGRYLSLKASWTVPGGTEVEYLLQQVFIMGYDSKTAELLSRNINKTCPRLFKTRWRRHKLYEILTFLDVPERYGNSVDVIFLDKDCTSAINFALHELQLMRVEEAADGKMKKLFLGDVHTSAQMRQSYRPTAYQTALFSSHDDGSVCETIKRSNITHPPLIGGNSLLSVELDGTWVSHLCEAQPQGMFLLRLLTFASNSSEWHGFFHFYKDPFCTSSTFSFYASGSYQLRDSYNLIKGTELFDLNVKKLKITPKDGDTVLTLNGHKGNDCAKDGSWKVNVEQDVTPTNGCKTFGIHVPHIQLDLVRIEGNLKHQRRIYMGKQPSDGLFRLDYRPSSFQEPLLLCKDDPVSLRISDMRISHELTSSSCKERPDILILFLCCFHFLSKFC